MNQNNIPLELQELRQWVLWDLEGELVKDGIRLLKSPKQVSGFSASVNKPSTWELFENTLAVMIDDEYDGLGFVFSSSDPYVGIDFDNCFDENGQLKTDVLNIVKRLNSYTEISPSGNGIHVIVKAELQDFTVGTGMKKDSSICEIYTSARFFTMTGKVLLGQTNINESTNAVKELIMQYYPEKLIKNQASNNYKKYPRLKASTQRVKTKMFNSKYGKEIQALYNGQSTPHTKGKSSSELDFTLCMHLAFWCKKDKVAMKEILLESKLNREKWHRSSLGQQCYLEATIEAACLKQKKVYSKKY